MSGRTEWGDIVPKLVRERTMGFLIGNGLSRLCGAPSWGDLFSSPDVLKVLKQERVSQGTPYLELGYLLSQQEPVLWDSILRRLFDWASASTSVSRAHRALLQVLRPAQSPSKVAILTTNVDSLLESHGYRREHIGYIHGQPGEHANWIFTADKYWNSWNSDKGIGQVFKKFQAAGVLFLGYGHSNEDFDIIQTVIELRKQYFGQMYTLMTQQEAERGELRWRLNWQGIKVISYEMPLRHPTQQERDLFLTKALLDLAEDCGLDKHPERQQPYQELREWCETEISRLTGRRSSAAIVLGLAGVNRHAALPGAIPTSERRVAEAAEIRVEPGGPGYIVSAIGRAIGIDSFLVSKIASDEQGELVQTAIRGHADGARIFADFVEVAPPGAGCHRLSYLGQLHS
jgi:SIR2-like domain